MAHGIVRRPTGTAGPGSWRFVRRSKR
jgi:hypothetical protein